MWEACGLIGEGGRAAAVDHERIVEQRASSIREVWTGLEMWSQWRGGARASTEQWHCRWESG